MIEGLEYDDSDSPGIGLVRPGVPWAEVADHVKIVHGPLLIPPGEGDAEYSGAYWAGTQVVIAEGLGPDQDEAIREFRDVLRERGEA
jgi:hypothetical protein